MSRRIARLGEDRAAVGEYLASLSDEKRKALERLRKIIAATAPGAEECISYRLPSFRFEGRILVSLGATVRHCALYLLSSSTLEAFRQELEAYDTSTGTVRFQPDQPLPAALVRKLVRARIAQNRSRSARR